MGLPNAAFHAVGVAPSTLMLLFHIFHSFPSPSSSERTPKLSKNVLFHSFTSLDFVGERFYQTHWPNKRLGHAHGGGTAPHSVAFALASVDLNRAKWLLYLFKTHHFFQKFMRHRQNL